jgi:hypothetical protein
MTALTTSATPKIAERADMTTPSAAFPRIDDWAQPPHVTKYGLGADDDASEARTKSSPD